MPNNDEVAVTDPSSSTASEPASDAFSLDDLSLLANLPIDVVAAAASVEVDDGNCSMGEILVGIRGIVSGAESYADNALVAAAFAAYKAAGGGEERLMSLCDDVPPDHVARTIELSRDALSSLGERHDWPDFAAWLRELAIGVVQASTKGGILGIGGERVTRSESRFLTELTAALGTPEP